MAATTGYIAQECFRWPGYLSKASDVKFADIPNGIKGLAAVPPLGLAQILLFIGLMEVVTWPYYEGPWPGSVPEGKAPGDVAGEYWVRYSDPEEKAFKLNVEINNGRAAMLGSLGMLMHDSHPDAMSLAAVVLSPGVGKGDMRPALTMGTSSDSSEIVAASPPPRGA